MRMKTAHVLGLAVLCIAAVPLLASGDLAAAPTIGEVFSTVEFPDYGVVDFFEDLLKLGTNMAGSFTAIGDLFGFIVNETFINPEVGFKTLPSKYFLVCIFMMAVCIVMAVFSMFQYKREYVDK